MLTQACQELASSQSITFSKQTEEFERLKRHFAVDLPLEPAFLASLRALNTNVAIEKLSRKPGNEYTPGDAKKTSTLVIVAQWLRLQLKRPHLNAAYRTGSFQLERESINMYMKADIDLQVNFCTHSRTR